MKGLLLPAVMAIAVHAAILGLHGERSPKGPRSVPVHHAVTLALAYFSPDREPTPPAPRSVEPEPAPVEKRVARIKKDRASNRPRRQAPRETVEATRAEDREPALASLTPWAGPQQQTATTKGDPESDPTPSPDAAGPKTDAREASLPGDAVLREAFPAYKVNPAPAYPQVARRRGIQGTVFLEAFVSMLGRVTDLRVVQSSGHEVLDQAAVTAVRAWTFEPARRGDEPVEMWVKIPIRFELK